MIHCTDDRALRQLEDRGGHPPGDVGVSWALGQHEDGTGRENDGTGQASLCTVGCGTATVEPGRAGRPRLC